MKLTNLYTSTSIAFIPLLYCSSALARGGRGGSGDAAIMFSVLAILGVGAAGLWLKKSYPNFFPILGGLVVLLMLGQFAAVVLAAIGIIDDGNIPYATLVILLLFIVTPVVSHAAKKNLNK